MYKIFFKTFQHHLKFLLFQRKNLTTNMLSEFEVLRHKDGFFKCEKCPRRFLTKVGFENHSSNQHQKENGTKLDELPTEKYPNDILVCRLSSQSTTDLQSSAHETPVFNKCIQCKQSFDSKNNLQSHLYYFSLAITPKIFWAKTTGSKRHWHCSQKVKEEVYLKSTELQSTLKSSKFL